MKRAAPSAASAPVAKRQKNLVGFAAPAPPPPLAESKTTRELRALSPADAAATLARLVSGYTNSRSGSSYPAAVELPNGCLLAQKQANRAINGYVQIAPIRARTGRGANGTNVEKPAPQSAHRLAVVAHQPASAVAHMLDDGWHASHRCHNTWCFRVDHIVVEPKEKNEARKACNGKLVVLTVEIAGRKVEVEQGD